MASGRSRRAAVLAFGALLAAPAGASAANPLVTTTSPTGPGSITAAIQAVNAGSPSGNTISFAIGAVSSQQTITVTGALPPITKPVVIDALTQGAPAYGGPPLIRLSGADADGTEAAGLQLDPGAAGSIVRGLAVTRFTRTGILVRAAGAQIARTFVGVNLPGQLTQGRGNLGGGIVVDASGVIVGGSAADGNVIGDNQALPPELSATACGVDVVSGAGSLVAGNRIGTTPDGTSGLGNPGTCGVRVGGTAANTTIGLTPGGSGAANVIAKNGTAGIEIVGGTGTAIRGNLIGLAADGTSDLGNSGMGIRVDGGTATTIGGDDAAGRNVISANTTGGISVTSAAPGVRIAGNTIGLAADGITVRGNGTGAGGYGVRLSGPGTTVGGPTATPGAGPGNVISGNTGSGVLLSGVTATGNTVEGNLIGLALDDSAQRNTGDGVRTTATGGQNVIGGTAVAQRNVISGNDSAGVRLGGGADAVLGNRIGTSRDGITSHGNAVGAVLQGAGGNVGGAAAGAGNLLSGNAGDGVLVTSGATGVAVQGNQVGGGPSQDDTVAANGGAQIHVTGSADHVLVGGTHPGAGNTVIDVNPTGTIRVDGSGAAVTVRGNRVPLKAGLTAWDVGPGGITSAGAPALTSVLTSAARSQVFGTLVAQPASTYAVDVYATASCAPAHRSADRYLGSGSVTTDATGTGELNFPVDGVPATGEVLVAAATGDGGQGSTSELGPCGPSASPAPTLALASTEARVTERAGKVTLTVVRTGGGDGSASVRFRTVDGTAVAGTDYVASSGSAQVNADQTSVTFDVPILRDGLAAGDKAFRVVLDATNAAVLGATDTSTVTVVDDPDPPVVIVPPAPRPKASISLRLTSPASLVRRAALRAIRGTATAKATTVAKVEVALTQAGVCRRLHLGGRLLRDRVQRCPPLFLRARGTKTWSLALPRSLPAGRYVVRARAVARSGLRAKTVQRTIRVR